MVKYWINSISRSNWSSVLETWHHKCVSQKKQNDTLSAVAIVPVSFCQKKKQISPFATSKVRHCARLTKKNTVGKTKAKLSLVRWSVWLKVGIFSVSTSVSNNQEP